MSHVAVGPAGVIDPVTVLPRYDTGRVMDQILVEGAVASARNERLVGIDPAQVPFGSMASAARGQVHIPYVALVPLPVVSDLNLRNVERRPFHDHHQGEVDSLVLPEVDGVD